MLERSCGAVVATEKDGVRYYVLVKGSYVGLPKGHMEPGESERETALREVREETGLTLTSYKFRGVVTFVSGDELCEYMALYTADEFEGELAACDEGDLHWIKKSKLLNLNLWEGDKIFLKLLTEDAPFFSLKLKYDSEGNLIETKLEGTSPINLFILPKKL